MDNQFKKNIISSGIYQEKNQDEPPIAILQNLRKQVLSAEK